MLDIYILHMNFHLQLINILFQPKHIFSAGPNSTKPIHIINLEGKETEEQEEEPKNENIKRRMIKNTARNSIEGMSY